MGPSSAGQTATQSLTVTTLDGTDSETITITITGTNDGPLLAAGGSASASVTETTGTPAPGAVDLGASGSFGFTDVDTRDVATVSASLKSVNGGTDAGALALAVGSLTASVSGDTNATNGGSVDWNYAVDPALIEGLAKDQTLVLVYTLTVSDGQGGTVARDVTITIIGTNDAPTISGEAAGAVSEGDDGSAMSDSGLLSVSDPDINDSHSWSVTGAASHGTASVDPDGTWHYTVTDDGAVDALGVGETMTDTFTVTVDDGHGGTDTQEIVVTIAGTNDGPDISIKADDSASASLDESNGALTIAGTLSVEDVDTSDTVSASVTDVMKQGDKIAMVSSVDLMAMLSLAQTSLAADQGSTGNLDWSFDSGSEAFDFLAEGETLILIYTVEVQDNHGASDSQDITITIHGTNDGPTGAASAVLELGTEDMAYTVSAADLLQGFSDVDGDTLSIANLQADHGTVTDNHDGTFTIEPADNYHGAVTLTYNVIDGHGGSAPGTLSFELASVQDLFAQDDSYAGDEDTVIGGDVSDNDSTTSGGSLAYAVATGPAHGSLTLNGDGTFTYTVVTKLGVETGTGDSNDNDNAGPAAAATAYTSVDGQNNGSNTINGSNLSDLVYAGSGNDTVYGHNGNDTIYGQVAADSGLYGQGGDDSITGGQGADTIYGGSGNDTIFGYEGPDNTTNNTSSNDGADSLYGGSGSDTIYGQTSDDNIVGGFGMDVLWGNGGADSFRFIDVRDRGDLIRDFNIAEGDILNVLAIDANSTNAVGTNDTFAWGGTTATANGLWYAYNAVTNVTTLYGDTDGNVATAEFWVDLTGNVDLQAAYTANQIVL